MLNKVIKSLTVFWNKIQDDGILKESAALTYVTMLGSIPFIIFLLYFLPDLPFLEINAKISSSIKEIFLPNSADLIYKYIQQLANKKIPFNLFSFVILLISSYSLFQIINSTFDKILNAQEFQSKNFFSNLVKFFGMTVLGSLLILILLSTTSLPFLVSFFEVPFLQRLFLYLTPEIIMFTVFSFGFFYIPTVKVKFRSIIIGAACSSITWILFKSLFNWYVVHLTNIELLWGVLASLPIFLFWIYSTWVIMLSGITIVSILENRHIPVKSDIPSQKLRITIEKSINKDEMIKLSTPTLLNKDDVKEILTDIFTEFSKKNTLDNKETKKK